MSSRPSQAASEKDKTQRGKGMGIKCLTADMPIRSLLLALYHGFLLYFLLKGSVRTGKAAQQMMALTAQPDSLSSTPGPTWWKERTNSHKLFFDLHIHGVVHFRHMHAHEYVCTYTCGSQSLSQVSFLRSLASCLFSSDGFSQCLGTS